MFFPLAMSLFLHKYLSFPVELNVVVFSVLLLCLDSLCQHYRCVLIHHTHENIQCIRMTLSVRWLLELYKNFTLAQLTVMRKKFRVFFVHLIIYLPQLTQIVPHLHQTDCKKNNPKIWHSSENAVFPIHFQWDQLWESKLATDFLIQLLFGLHILETSV